MEANLPTETPGGDEPTGKARWAPGFPFSNWGPLAAVLGVLLAIGTGIVVGIPAIVIGHQSGGIERFAPPGASGLELDADNTSAVAADPRYSLVYGTQGSSLAVVGAGDDLVPGSPYGDFGDATGVAAGSGRVFVADPEDESIAVLRQSVSTSAADPSVLATSYSIDSGPAGDDPFEPEALALSGRKPGAVLYAIDSGSEAVDRFSLAGAYLGRLGRDEFDFGEHEGENAVAADSGSRRGAGIVYVLGDRAGADERTIWAFDRGGARLWRIPAPGGEDACGLAVASDGSLWIADSSKGVERYALTPDPHRPPSPTGEVVAEGREGCGIATGREGDLYVARDVPPLTTAANIFVQLATALGFLLVPFAIAAGRGASARQGARRLGLRRFKPGALKWMAAAVGAYLLFAFVYVAIAGQPEQEDIAEGFGTIPIQVLLIVIAAPISEEVCFRGMLFGGLRERFPRIVAALISGAIFGALHAFTGISAVPPLIAFGFILALLYERTGSVVPGIILHMLNNSVALLGQ